VDNVERAANPRVFFKRFTDAKTSRQPEHVVIKGNQNLSKEMSHDSVAEVVKPVILVGRPGEGVLCPVVDGVNVPPQPGVDMQGAVHPVHPKGHEVVVGKQGENTIW